MSGLIPFLTLEYGLSGKMISLWFMCLILVNLLLSTFKVKNGLDFEFHLTYIYASCYRICRRDLWVDLLNLSTNSSLPWIVGGDFNCVLATTKVVGRGRFDFPSADDFNDFIQFTGLDELQYHGNLFSWCNNQQGIDRIYKRLDRPLGNTEWLEKVSYFVTYLDRVYSDHAPMLIEENSEWNGGPSPFKFQTMWLEHPNFLDFVRYKWDYTASSSPLLNLCLKLKGLKQNLKWWNKNEFGDINLKHGTLLNELSAIETELQGAWSDTLWERLLAVRKEFFEADKQHEIFLKQKARVNWLKAGDKNSRYFHLTVQEKRKYNAFISMRQTWPSKDELRT